jgi:hypothetical protein
MGERYRPTSRWSTPVVVRFLFEYRATQIPHFGDLSGLDIPPIMGRRLAVKRRNLVHRTRKAMVQLPSLTMQSERAQLAQVMSQPFARRADYEQTKQAFHHFVQDLRASKVMGCLVAMKAG